MGKFEGMRCSVYEGMGYGGCEGMVVRMFVRVRV